MGRLALPVNQRFQRFPQFQGNIPYSSGAQSNPLPLVQTEYMAALDLISKQQVASGSAAPTGLNGAGAYAALGNIQLKANGGVAPYALPGWHANIFEQTWNHDYVDGLATAPLVTSATNNWKNHIHLPLTVDPVTQKGCFYTGDVTLNLSLQLSMDTAAQMFGTVNGATVQGSWDVWADKFAGPAPDVPGGWLDEISYLQFTKMYQSGVQLSNGTTPINLEVDQDFVTILLIFYTGTRDASSFAPANALYTSMNLTVNDRKIWDTVPEDWVRFTMLQTYDLVLPAGTAVIDFNRLEPASRRDILPTDPQSTKRLLLEITSTSTANFVDVVTQTTVDSEYAVKWIQSAKQRAGKRAA